MTKIERRGCDYYLCPALDALEAAIPSRWWGKQKGVPFETHLIQLKSSAAIVSFKLALSSHGLVAAYCLIDLLIFRSWAGRP